jgi:hypothetical protein
VFGFKYRVEFSRARSAAQNFANYELGPDQSPENAAVFAIEDDETSRGTEQRCDHECKAAREGTGFPHDKPDYDRCDNAARLRAGAD